MRGPERPARPPSCAPLVERLGVLLEAGVAPAPAWRHLAESVVRSPRDGEIARAAAHALERGRPAAPAIAEAVRASPHSGGIPRSEWLQLAAAWHVAEASGAALAVALTAFAEAFRSSAAAHRAVDTALSGPRTTSRIVLALPAVGLLLGLALGFDTGRILFGTPAGWCSLTGAVLLVIAASAWNGRLVKSAVPGDEVPGLRLELLAVAIGGGGAWARASALVDEVVSTYLSPTPPQPEAEDTGIGELISLSERAGVPAALLLRSEAGERRRDARASAERDAERLGVLLMLPLGVCILPAFLLVGVVPLVLALFSSTASSF